MRAFETLSSFILLMNPLAGVLAFHRPEEVCYITEDVQSIQPFSSSGITSLHCVCPLFCILIHDCYVRIKQLPSPSLLSSFLKNIVSFFDFSSSDIKCNKCIPSQWIRGTTACLHSLHKILRFCEHLVIW